MRVQVLVSTMNQKNHDLIGKMNLEGDAVIINQTDIEKHETIEIEKSKIHFISTKDRGLSKSRNLAIKNSDADICVIADDDLSYINGYGNIISKAHEECLDCDIIAFDVLSDNEERPTNKLNKSKVGYLNSMKLASFQLTFKRNSFIKHNIKFNENFGAGSGKFTCGEENLLLIEALKKGLKVKYCEIPIANVSHDESTWFNGFDEKLFITKGAMFYKMSTLYYLPLIIQYAVRKHKLYKKDFTIFQSLKLMMKGRKEFKDLR